MGSFSNSDLAYMFFSGLKNGSIGTIGAKGDPGGLVLGTLLTNGADLNTITTPGTYRIISTTGILNTPQPVGGSIAVYQVGTTPATAMQEYTMFTSADTRQGFYRRILSPTTGLWLPWRFFSPTRIDETAGRAIYQWDDLNNREQLIYGDTGQREIKTTLLNGWVAVNLIIRRVGRTVYLTVMGLDKSLATAQEFAPNIPGFRPAFMTNVWLSWAEEESNVFFRNQSGFMTKSNYGFGRTISYGTFSWSTDDPWPTTLPGTAVGTVPYN